MAGSRWQAGAPCVLSASNISGFSISVQARTSYVRRGSTIGYWFIYLVWYAYQATLRFAAFYTVEIGLASEIWESVHPATVVLSSLSNDDGDTNTRFTNQNRPLVLSSIPQG